MKIIVHFGMPKTGSSSIQRALFKNIPDPRFKYISLHGVNQNEQLITLFSANPHLGHAHRRKGSSSEEVERLRAMYRERLESELCGATGKTAILSAEAIYNFNESALTDLRDFLSSFSGDMALVGYVRSPKGFMESAFQQWIKTERSHFDLSRLFPRYRARFGNMDKAFGRENIRLWKFDPGVFPRGDVVLDFCARLGIEFPAEMTVRANEGFSAPAMSLLYTYRKFGPAYGVGQAMIRENRLLIDRLAELDGQRFYFHSNLVKPLVESHRQDIAWMEEWLGEPLQEGLCAHDEDAVHSEKDLFVYSPETLRWLSQQLGPDYEHRWHSGMSPQTVAEWVHALRLKLANEDAYLQQARRVHV